MSSCVLFYSLTLKQLQFGCLDDSLSLCGLFSVNICERHSLITTG